MRNSTESPAKAGLKLAPISSSHAKGEPVLPINIVAFDPSIVGNDAEKAPQRLNRMAFMYVSRRRFSTRLLGEDLTCQRRVQSEKKDFFANSFTTHFHPFS